MDLFLVNLYDLKTGDQYEVGDSKWNTWEVFLNKNGIVKVFQVDVPLFREDGTVVRNMLFNRRYISGDKQMVKPVVNKKPVLNRNHMHYDFPETFLYTYAEIDEIEQMVERKTKQRNIVSNEEY